MVYTGFLFKEDKDIAYILDISEERIQQIKDSNNPINKFKKKKIHRDDEEQEFQGAFDYREFITNNAEEIAEAEEKSSNKGKRGDNQWESG